MIVARRTPGIACLSLAGDRDRDRLLPAIVTSLAIIRGGTRAERLRPGVDRALLCTRRRRSSAPDSPEESARVETARHPPTRALAALPVFLIPLVGYGALFIQPLGGAGDSFRALLTGLMTVAGLGVLTLRLAAQGSELQRADARMRLLAAATEQTGDLILITRADGGVRARERRVRARARLFARASSPDSASPISSTVVPAPCRRRSARRSANRASGAARCCASAGTAPRFRRRARLSRSEMRAAASRTSSAPSATSPGAQAARSARAQRAAVGDRRARGRRRPRDQQSAADDHRFGRVAARGRPDQGSRHDLEIVRREAARAGQIVRNLLSFVRRSAPIARPPTSTTSSALSSSSGATISSSATSR